MQNSDSVSRISAGVLFLLIVCVVMLNGVATASVAPPPITISVDATQVSRRILHAKLVFPVHPGPLTLYYPKWMPADHSPDGPVWNLAGLKFLSGGRQLPWQQDDVDMYAFHLVVPKGISGRFVGLPDLGARPNQRFQCFGGGKLVHPDVEPGPSLSERVACQRAYLRANPHPSQRLEIQHFPADR